MTPRATLRRQAGIAVVEFAIALPLLLLLLLATAEIGRMLSQYDTVTKGARDGARYLASNALTGTTGVVVITPAVQTAVANLVTTGNVAGGAALLPGFTAANVTASGLASGYVQVSASYTYQPMVSATLITFGLGAGPNLNIALTSTVVMKPL